VSGESIIRHLGMTDYEGAEVRTGAILHPEGGTLNFSRYKVDAKVPEHTVKKSAENSDFRQVTP
jgi:hypothetical protein